MLIGRCQAPPSSLLESSQSHMSTQASILRCRNRAGGNPRRPHDRGRRRRGPRERRRPHHGRREDHARSHQLHGQVRPRPGLPRHDRRAAGLSAPRPDVGREHLQLRHRVHRIHRRQRRRLDRHLGLRPRAHHSASPSIPRPGPTIWRVPGTSFRCAPAKAACWFAPAKPKLRSIWRAWRAWFPPASSARS